MNRIFLAVLTIVVLCVMCPIQGMTKDSLAAGSEENTANKGVDLYEQLDLFGTVLEIVRSSYLKDPELKKLISAAMAGMLNSLDPHSDYLDPEAFKRLSTQTSGKFGGLGIEVTMQDGLVRVVSPIDDTPAMRSGIMSGDLITHLDNKPIIGLSLLEAVEKMRGDVGTPIVLTIKREGYEKLLKVKIIRKIIHIRSVRHRIERDNIGYIRITTFNQDTSAGLSQAFQEIKEKLRDNLKGYVIDLRNNPGGLLTQAVEVSDMFLDRGEIVFTRGRDEKTVSRYNARQGNLVGDKPVFVLINGGSASAAEIVAGALQDQERAVVLGTRSFGKGSVQTVIPLGEHGALRMTTARYYTPSGRSIQAKGIRPDLLVKQELPDQWKALLDPDEAFGESALPRHLNRDGEDDPNGDGEEGDIAEDEREDSSPLTYIPQDPKQDVQLNYALDLLSGKRNLQDEFLKVRKKSEIKP